MGKYKQIKKSWVLLLTFPFLFALIAWLLPVSTKDSTVTTTAVISLGSYDNEDWNNEHRINSMLTSPKFYQQYAQDLWHQRGTNLWKNLSVTTENHTVQLTYTNNSEANALADLNEIVLSFLSADKSQFQDKKQLIQSTINTLQKQSVSMDTVVDQQRFLYELHSSLSRLQAAEMVQDPKESMITYHSLSEKKRILLGLLIGCMLSVCWFVVARINAKASTGVEA